MLTFAMCGGYYYCDKTKISSGVNTMWFKQAQIFQLQTSIAYDAQTLEKQLEPLAFRPCLATFPFSYGWVSPVDEDDAPLVHASNGHLLICLQVEEKVLPAVVVRQELDKKIKNLETLRDRKIPQKEKYALKEEIIHTLLPRAFSKLSRIYAYIDTKNNWLVLDTVSAPKIQKCIEFLKKIFEEITIQPMVTSKLSPMLTQWLTQQNYPQAFAVEKSCVLADVNQKNRVIRCQQQDLFAASIESFIKDNCEVKQIALSWQDTMQFVLTEDFSLLSIKFQDKVIAQAKDMEPETKKQQFDVDFFIMTEIFSSLLEELLSAFSLRTVGEPQTMGQNLTHLVHGDASNM